MRLKRPHRRRCVCYALPVLCLILFFALLSPPTAHFAHPDDDNADATEDRTKSHSLSPPFPSPFPPAPVFIALKITLHRSLYFPPRRIGAALLSEPRDNAPRDNDSPVTPAELSRAAHNILFPLPQEKLHSSADGMISLSHFSSSSSSSSSSYFDADGDALMAHFANFVLSAANDAAPLIADYGCRIAAAFARRHNRSTVLCIADDNIAARPQPRTLPNMLRIVARGGIVPVAVDGIYNNKNNHNNNHHIRKRRKRKGEGGEGEGGGVDKSDGFAPFFMSCSFMSVATLFTAAVPLRRGAEDFHSVLDTAAQALRNSGALLIALPLNMAADCSQLLSQLEAREEHNEAATYDGKDIFNAKEEKEGKKWFPTWRRTLQCEAVASLSDPHTNTIVLTLFRVDVQYARSVCRKTWAAPLVIWGRAVVREYNNTRVSFRVVDKTSAAGTAATASRRISPLQYVPSVSLDVLLGAGIHLYERLRLFGDMLTTPRYSDPLPHNWMIGNADAIGMGGRAFRIDIKDRRFDKAVEEEKNYWATAARGYVRLLSYHMCLPMRSSGGGRGGGGGVPEVMYELNERCRAQCRICLVECVYGPNGIAPCEACVQCGTCVRRHAEEKDSISGHPFYALEQAEPCLRSYRNYAVARKVWEAWRLEDLRHPISF